MEYRRLGRTGLMVSELCLGCMTFGRELDEEGSRKIIARFLEAGANFIDTADVYSKGVSEEITGRAIKGSRDEVVLATKVRFPMGEGPNDVGLSRKHVISGCEASLQRLGTDYIDLYQVHTWDALTPLEETLSALTDLIRAGKVTLRGRLELYRLAADAVPVDKRAAEPREVRLPAAAVLARGAEHRA
jgi:aryl-alcohol dehydrogenase-like predicted oxidoreductase